LWVLVTPPSRLSSKETRFSATDLCRRTRAIDDQRPRGGNDSSREKEIIQNELEGSSTIIYLIPEGKRVKKGELLVELDASNLIDQRVDQQIKVQNAEAAYINARENLAIVESQAQSDIDKPSWFTISPCKI
jgi:hypothetical protein